MFRATKIAVAAILSLSIGALPVVLDRCAESCEVHAALTSAPSCHHLTSTASRIGQVPSPCSHDHHGTALSASNSSAPTVRSISVTAATIAVPHSFPPAKADRQVPVDASPGATLTLDTRSLPLRV
jgi:hypothetical protein